MANDIKPTTIYINGVPISGVKEINLEPAHPTGDADMYRKQIADKIKKEFHVPVYIDLDEMYECKIDNPWLKCEFGTKLINDDAVAIGPITRPKQPEPEPKKVYLTTSNPYMSKDWKKRFEEIVEARMKTDPWSITVDTDVASMYPKLESLVKEELAVHSPSKQLYEVGKLAAKGFNKNLRKVHEDAFDAVRYSFDKYCDYAMEKSWEDYCYMIPPRAGKSAALGAIKLGEKELEYCKQDVEETMRLYNAFKEKGDDMRHKVADKDYTIMCADEIMNEMRDMLNKTRHAERNFANDEWIWDISGDIICRLKTLYPISIGWGTVLGIAIHPNKLRINHIELVRKVKEEEKNMTVSEKIKMIEAKLEKVAEDVNARVYTKYNGRKQTLEYVFVEKGTGYTFTNERELEELLGSLCDPLSTGIYTLRSHVSKCFYAWKKQMNNTGHFLDYTLPQIKDVKFEDPATIVFWKDGTKTVVRAQDEAYDPEKGLAMAIARKSMGNKRDYYHVFLKWLKKFKKKENKICDEFGLPERLTVVGKPGSKGSNCEGECSDCCPVWADDISKTGIGCKNCDIHANHFTK